MRMSQGIGPEVYMTNLEAPQSMLMQHENMLRNLDKAALLDGQTAQAARKIAKRLIDHFKREEATVIPLLSLLPALISDQASPHFEQALTLHHQLEADLSMMVAEHRAIERALDELITAGEIEGRPSAITWAKQMKLHLQAEEEISYRSALLVGKYIHLKAQIASASKLP